MVFGGGGQRCSAGGVRGISTNWRKGNIGRYTFRSEGEKGENKQKKGKDEKPDRSRGKMGKPNANFIGGWS